MDRHMILVSGPIWVIAKEIHDCRSLVYRYGGFIIISGERYAT